MSLRAAALDDALAIRGADADLLSLALIDARNLTLRWLEVFEARGQDGNDDGGPPARWLAGHAGWYAEYWIARHVQRGRGEHADPSALRLPSVDARADAWFQPGAAGPPDAAAVREYLAATLDVTLELLAAAAADDDALHLYRLALLHEDRLGERLAERAAHLQLDPATEPPPPWRAQRVLGPREPLWFPPSRLMLGSAPGGCVPDNERAAHEERVPEFEIDAQVVTWERFVEFAEDGGYDRADLWSQAGWSWVQAQGRRAPRDVEQVRGGVLLQRHGRLQRLAPGQAVQHVSRHEAEAWCRWAGRRLPTEPEWELAALTGRARGFAWGDVFEWVAGSARPWPGHATGAASLDRLPEPGTQGVMRGASWMTAPRWRHPKARRFAVPEADSMFVGFRSCAP